MPNSSQNNSKNAAPHMNGAEDWPLKHIIQVQDVPPSGKYMPYAASQEECAAVAEFLEIPKVSKISAELHIKPYSNGDVRVTGPIDALVTYICGVTLQPYEDEIHTDVNILYVDSERRKAMLSKWAIEDILDLDKDIPDELINGQIPLGGLMCEQLALAMDPYPRMSDAEFDDVIIEDDEKPASPFGVLKGL